MSGAAHRSDEEPSKDSAGPEVSGRAERQRSGAYARALHHQGNRGPRRRGNLMDIARATKLAPSTTHRLLTTLQQDRFVQFEAHGARWLIGVEAFIVGSAFLQGETSHAARAVSPSSHGAERRNREPRDHRRGMAVYMGQVESRQAVRAICRPGGRVFLHSSALGKSMLAAMTPEEIGRILRPRG